MNYLMLVNTFWDKNLTEPSSATEIALYYFLLHLCNKGRWKEPFRAANNSICSSLIITEKTLIRARNHLSEKGLIKYKSNKGRKHLTNYFIIKTYQKNWNNSSISDSISDSNIPPKALLGKQLGEFKQNKTKYNNNKYENKKTINDILATIRK